MSGEQAVHFVPRMAFGAEQGDAPHGRYAPPLLVDETDDRAVGPYLSNIAARAAAAEEARRGPPLKVQPEFVEDPDSGEMKEKAGTNAGDAPLPPEYARSEERMQTPRADAALEAAAEAPDAPAGLVPIGYAPSVEEEMHEAARPAFEWHEQEWSSAMPTATGATGQSLEATQTFSRQTWTSTWTHRNAQGVTLSRVNTRRQTQRSVASGAVLPLDVL